MASRYERVVILPTSFHSRPHAQRKRPSCGIPKEQISKGLQLQVQELAHYLETLHEQTTGERSVLAFIKSCNTVVLLMFEKKAVAQNFVQHVDSIQCFLIQVSTIKRISPYFSKKKNKDTNQKN